MVRVLPNVEAYQTGYRRDDQAGCDGGHGLPEPRYMSWALLLSYLCIVDGGISDASRQWCEWYLHVGGSSLLQQ